MDAHKEHHLLELKFNLLLALTLMI